MIAYLFFGIILAAALLFLLNWWSEAETKKARNAILFLIIAIVAIISLLLIVAGKGFMAILPIGLTVWRVGSALFGSGLLGRFFGSQQKQNAETKQKSNDRSQSVNNNGLTIKEAAEILGIEETATKQEILEAYKRRITAAHPDKGGSDWMAAKINEAKLIMLNNLSE